MSSILPKLNVTQRLVSSENYITLRFCVDYNNLKAVMIQDSYQMLYLPECLDTLGNATIFSTLDAKSSYCLVEICRGRLIWNLFSPLLGASSDLHQALQPEQCSKDISKSFGRPTENLKYQFTFVNLDDVIVFSRNQEEHIDHSWRQELTLAWKCTRINTKCSQIQLINSFMSLSLVASNSPHRRWTPYMDSNAP